MSRPLLGAVTIAALLATASSVGADGSRGPAVDRQGSETYAATACPDYGSYAVVDGARRSANRSVGAEPYNTCADLPTQARQPQIYIGADVQIGNNSGDTNSDTQGQTQQPPAKGRRPGQGGGSGGGMVWSPEAKPVLQPHPMRRP
jgi:hypothetical protein